MIEYQFSRRHPGRTPECPESNGGQEETGREGNAPGDEQTVVRIEGRCVLGESQELTVIVVGFIGLGCWCCRQYQRCGGHPSGRSTKRRRTSGCGRPAPARKSGQSDSKGESGLVDGDLDVVRIHIPVRNDPGHAAADDTEVAEHEEEGTDSAAIWHPRSVPIAAKPDRGQCDLALVRTQVIVLNGVSSSGKTSIARVLREMLVTPWLLLGVDDLIRAVSDKGIEDGSLLEALRPDRRVGMAESQVAVVREGVVYDLIVDTTHASSESCAARILAQASTTM